MFLERIYWDWLDVALIAGTAVWMAAMLRGLWRGDGVVSDATWLRVRWSFIAPVGAAILMGGIDGPFVVSRLLFHVGAVVYPMAGLVIVVAIRRRQVERRWHRAAANLFGVALVALAPLAIWMTAVEPYNLEVTHTRVTTDAADVEPLRVVVLSDVQTDHFGEWEMGIARRVNDLKPDVVVIPGDFLQVFGEDYARELAGAISFLERLDAPHGIYVVDGDADWNFRDYGLARGVTILDHEVARFEARGRRIAIAGSRLGYQESSVGGLVRELERDDAELKLLLAHRPMVARAATQHDSTIDLVIAGHTHGGQVSLPFVGPPVTLTEAPHHVARGGLSRLGGRQIYVSRGIGMERNYAPRIRLIARPELAVLEIE